MFPSFSATNCYTLGIDAPQDLAHDTHSLGIRSVKVLTRHLIKVGFEFLVLQMNESQGGSGTFSFTPAYTQDPNQNAESSTSGNSLDSFLLGAGSGTASIANERAVTSKYYAGYIADDWKLTSKLTLNVGLRYGVDTPLTECYRPVFMVRSERRFSSWSGDGLDQPQRWIRIPRHQWESLTNRAD